MDIKIHKLEYFKKWLILGIFIGIAAGVGALIFYYAIIYFQGLFLGRIAGTQLPSPVGEGNMPYVPGNYILIPVSILVGGLLSGLIVYKFAPEAEGHGTDAMIDSFHNKKGKIRSRVPIIKTIASAITIGSGGSAGREGPTAQITAGIGSFLSNIFRLDDNERRIAVLVGTGAGIGTIFKAPIGGALLAIEVPYKRDFETSALFPAIVASAIGYSIFGSIVGFQPIFGYYLSSFNPLNLPFYAVLGIACGIFAIFYVNIFYYIRRLFKSLKVSNYVKPMIGALFVGFIALIFPEVMGVGYGWVQILYNGNLNSLPTFGLPLLAILLLLPFAKIFATSFSIGSGGSGGVFAPGIFIGASVGLLLGILFNHISPSIAVSVAPFVIIGSLAFMGAAGKIPISVLLMVTEMTGSLQLLPAAMIAVALSYLLSGNHTIYESQVPRRSDSPAHYGEYNKPILANMIIGNLPLVDFSISKDSMVSEARKLMKTNRVSELPVISTNGDVRRVVGMVSLYDLHAAKSSTIKDVKKTHTNCIKKEASASSALKFMANNGITWAPVISENGYIGCITLNTINNEYNKILKESNSNL